MIFVYLAAPVRPIKGETKEGNLQLAKRYYRELSIRYPNHVFLVPWLVNTEVFDESQENVDQGMARNRAVIEMLGIFDRCGERGAAENRGGHGRPELWLVGPRVSGGMWAEAEFAEERGLSVERHEVRVFPTCLDWKPPEHWYSQHCGDCGASFSKDDYHACEGVPMSR